MNIDSNIKELDAEILIVEDNPSSLKLLSDILIGAGYKTRPAPDGELALRSMQARVPDLILLDFNLPGINGIEVCRHLKDAPETRDIPVIFVSAMDKSELKVKALEAGAIDFITKPIDSAEVLARISTHLRMYRLQLKLASKTEELVNHQEHLEEMVEERTAKLLQSEKQITASLKEKEILLREIHHRVKNNMQTVVSLLNLHARKCNDDEVTGIFNECRNRVNAMSLIHQTLYQSKDVARIDFNNYVSVLSRNLGQSYGASGRGILISVGKCDVSLELEQSIAVGTIICELISNALKHAYPEDKKGTISINLCRFPEEQIELIVQDDGVGIATDLDIEKSESLGLNILIGTVTGKLNGTISVDRNKGTKYIIRFKAKKMMV